MTTNEDGFESSRRNFKKLMFDMFHGDESALEEFFYCYARTIVGAARIVKNTEDVVNRVIQQTLMKVWRDAERFYHMDVRKPEFYIFRMAQNYARDIMREKEYYPLQENVTAECKDIETMDDLDSFYSMIGDLSQREREIIVFLLVERMTFAEIAELLDAPISSISSTYYRAIEKLKKDPNFVDKFLK